MNQLLIVGALWAAWYTAACWWFPMAKCWCCSGSGKHVSKSGKKWHPCRICSGNGSYFRLGRRLLGWFWSSGDGRP